MWFTRYAAAMAPDVFVLLAAALAGSLWLRFARAFRPHRM